MKRTEKMTEIFAVVGRPIAHSKSPQMHNAAFASEGIDAAYTRIHAETAKEAIQIAKEIGMKGLNITAPFKESFAAIADELDESAKATGMVNTLRIENKKIRGFNTDTVGIIGALIAHNVRLEGKNAVILGAGGAAAAAAYTLTSVDAKVTIANRTLENAKKLAKRFNCSFCSLEKQDLEKIIPEADVIISTISTHEQIVPPELLQKRTVVLEANYSKKTALHKDAASAGCKIIDGSEWLLFQGLRAFEILTGKKAPAEVMQKTVGEKHAERRNIALVGFMGSGKTAVAKEIANATGMNAIDIDADIEKKTGEKINNIFEKYGEQEFRKMENEEIKKIKHADNSVISCGGGIVLNPENIDELKKHCTVIWLYVSARTALHRTHEDRSRPLLNILDKEKVAESIVRNRMERYAKASDLIINTENKSIAHVAELIMNELHNRTG